MVLKRRNSLKKICNTLVRPGLMLRNKNEEPAQPSSPQSPGEQSKSVDKEVSYREGSDKDKTMLECQKLRIQIIIKSLVNFCDESV